MTSRATVRGNQSRGSLRGTTSHRADPDLEIGALLFALFALISPWMIAGLFWFGMLLLWKD